MTPAIRADRQSITYSVTAARSSGPGYDDAEILLLLFQQALVGLPETVGRDRVPRQAGEVEPAVRDRREEPRLSLVDVPRAGEAGVGRFEKHVAVGAGHLDVAAVQVVVKVDVLGF